MLTEEEVKRLEEQRGLQERERRALAGMSPDSAMRYREAQERQHWDDMYRQSHGGLSRAEVRNLGPDGSGRQAAGIARAAELQAAHERQKDVMGTKDVTRIEEARLKAQGVENQGVGAAGVRAEADRDIADRNLADKDLQRKHDLEMLGRTQTFQGTQAEAERRNRLDIADVQGKSAVATARAQAEARAADIAAKNEIEREKIAARKEIAAMRENGKLTQAGAARLSKTYGGLVGAGYSPARVRALLKDEGWTDEEINAAQGRQQ
ncbi:MAG: hypothetical protein SPK87_01205 [Bacteroidales bacterium]|nr:hypothetical protein [Bacteroidales bacterium]